MTEETEQETRKRRIDHKLEASGWKLIKYHESKPLSSYLSHDIEEYPTSNGPVDYALVILIR
jgi:type I restriction enzyme R subunit